MYYQSLVIPQDDHITVIFFPGFQLATGKKSRFLYDLVRAGSLTGSAVITHDVTTGTGYCLVGFNWIIDFLN